MNINGIQDIMDFFYAKPISMDIMLFLVNLKFVANENF